MNKRNLVSGLMFLGCCHANAFAATMNVPSQLLVSAMDTKSAGTLLPNGAWNLNKTGAVSNGYHLLANNKYAFAINAYGPSVAGKFTYVKVSLNDVVISKFNVTASPQAIHRFEYTAKTTGVAVLKIQSSIDVKGRDLYLNSVTASSVADTVAPFVRINSSPGRIVAAATPAVFGFQMADADSGIDAAATQCIMDGVVVAPCISPKSYANLPAGSHSFQVQAFDHAKNSAMTKAFAFEVKPAPTPVLGNFVISSAQALSTSSVQVNFGASANATSYTVKYGTVSGAYPTVASTSATSPATITGLASGKTYFIMVTAVNGSVTKNASAPISVTTKTDTGTTPVTVPVVLPALSYLPSSLGPRFVNGIEPSKACEAPAGNKCLYVDALAADGGNGSAAAPFNSFEKVRALILGGDVLYVSGVFVADGSTTKNKRLILGNEANGISADQLTVIKSWPGKPKAHFQGQDKYSNLISFEGDNKFVRVANIEVSGAKGRGIGFYNASALVILEDLYIHHNQGDTGQNSPPEETYGEGGGIWLASVGYGAEIILRNSCFEVNNLLYDAATKKLVQNFSRNNFGAFSINSENGAASASATVRIYNNIFNNETAGVRHKHPGNIVTEVSNNVFMNSARGMFVRSFDDNLVHHNVFFNITEGAIFEYNESTKGDLQASIYNNNFFNARMLANMAWPGVHPAYYSFRNNFYHHTEATPAIDVSPGNYKTMTFTSNLFLTRTSAAFLLLNDQNTVYQRIDFADFNSKQGGSNIRYDHASGYTEQVQNHNAAFAQYLEQLKAKNIGAFKP